MKKAVLYTSAVLILAGSTMANAEVYLGATVGSAQHSYSDVDSSNASKLFLGYQFGDSWGVEVATVDLGTADVDGTTWDFEIDGQQAAVVYSFMPLKENGGNFYIKLGAYSFDTTLNNVFLLDTTDSSTNVMWGLGGRYVLVGGLVLTGEISGYNDVSYITDDQIATTFDIGLQYNFF